MPTQYLAQLNIGRLLAPIDAPEIADFANALDEINGLAESSPGFVWRLKDEVTNNATSLAYTDDPLLIPNLSVWTSISQLSDFVYRTAHTPFLRRRREWFERMEVVFVLWWIPTDHLPTVSEGLERLEDLRENGPTSRAFTFARPHEPEGAEG
jgi:hypothetical protein